MGFAISSILGATVHFDECLLMEKFKINPVVSATRGGDLHLKLHAKPHPEQVQSAHALKRRF